jgi:hypothetical protein
MMMMSTFTMIIKVFINVDNNLQTLYTYTWGDFCHKRVCYILSKKNKEHLNTVSFAKFGGYWRHMALFQPSAS